MTGDGSPLLDPRQVAITGKVRASALDKTGTLTQAWLVSLAVQPAQARPTSSPHSGKSFLTYERSSCLMPTVFLHIAGPQQHDQDCTAL